MTLADCAKYLGRLRSKAKPAQRSFIITLIRQLKNFPKNPDDLRSKIQASIAGIEANG